MASTSSHNSPRPAVPKSPARSEPSFLSSALAGARRFIGQRRENPSVDIEDDAKQSLIHDHHHSEEEPDHDESKTNLYSDDPPYPSQILPSTTAPLSPPAAKRPRRGLIAIILGCVLLILAAMAAAVLSRKTLGFEIPILDKTLPQDSVNHYLDGTPDKSSEIPNPNGRQAIIVSSFKDQQVDWMMEVNRPKDLHNWEIYRYINDVSEDSYPLTVDNPNGREALAYLTFIIDNYDNLPDYMVFIHGHGTAWHQPSPMQYKIWALNTQALAKYGYFNLRCQSKGCTNSTMFYFDNSRKNDNLKATRESFPTFWRELIEDQFGPLPKRLGHTCCAQFAASKAAVLRTPLAFWEHLRLPLLKSHWNDFEFRKGHDGYQSGLFYEHIWAVVMGAGMESCPGDNMCNKVFFQDYIKCDHPPPIWVHHKDWEQIKCAWTGPDLKLHDTNNETTIETRYLHLDF